MGFIVKLMLTACVVFGFHEGVKYLVNTTATAQLGEMPRTPPLPTVEPEALRRAMEVGRAFDTTAQRAAIDDAARRIEQMNRTIPLPLPPPVQYTPPQLPNIPGMPRH